ncbi:hypothetical protein [Halococcus sediminicola]|uniref:hypothetical protein n=1 Tax=Halococcus sediminicola TaxID=1264579 RepID=UPI000679B277|nr:hypothetical protein [Halococcus sediminicola]
MSSASHTDIAGGESENGAGTGLGSDDIFAGVRGCGGDFVAAAEIPGPVGARVRVILAAMSGKPPDESDLKLAGFKQ